MDIHNEKQDKKHSISELLDLMETMLKTDRPCQETWELIKNSEYYQYFMGIAYSYYEEKEKTQGDFTPHDIQQEYHTIIENLSKTKSNIEKAIKADWINSSDEKERFSLNLEKSFKQLIDPLRGFASKAESRKASKSEKNSEYNSRAKDNTPQNHLFDNICKILVSLNRSPDHASMLSRVVYTWKKGKEPDVVKLGKSTLEKAKKRNKTLRKLVLGSVQAISGFTGHVEATIKHHGVCKKGEAD